jgi:probable HAF family extracellular repeat protein
VTQQRSPIPNRCRMARIAPSRLAQSAVFAVLALSASPARAQSFFLGLGDLPGGAASSQANALSADGTTVVGGGTSANGPEAFVWSAATGMIALGDLPGGVYSSVAEAASADGSVVVGNAESTAGTEAFIWTAESGMIGLGDLPGGSFRSTGHDISDDGLVVGGTGESSGGSEAFRWTAATGMIGFANRYSVGNGVSGDGLTVVGYTTFVVGQGLRAYRWTSQTGMVPLGTLPGGGRSIAFATSYDGSVVVGWGESSESGDDGFRWTEATGMVSLGFSGTGHAPVLASDLSTDGSVVVGAEIGRDWGDLKKAVLWDQAHGWRAVQTFLSSKGISLPRGWKLIRCKGVAINNGQITLCGGGTHNNKPEAWVAQAQWP